MSVIRTEPRFSVLTFIEFGKHYDHNAAYNSGKVTHVLNTPQNTIPPFQIIKLDNWNWSLVEIVNLSTGTATDIKSEMELTGLAGTEYDGSGDYGTYKLWEYPGSIELPVLGLTEGVHYIRMQDSNGNWVVSELFTFIDGLESRRDYVKIEWWSLTDMILNWEMSGTEKKSTAHIKYDAPFKWWLYVKSHLAMHGWKYEEDTETRNGIESSKKITRFKEFSFKFSAPEYLVDVLSLVPLNEKKTVIYDGLTHSDIWRFIPDATVAGAGNLYGVEVIFQTNKTTNTVNGSGYADTAYEIGDHECLSDATAGVLLDDSTTEYTNAEFLSDLGQTFNVQPGDYVLTQTAGGFIVVRQYTGSGYNNITETDYSNWSAILDARTTGVNATRGDYYFFALSGLLKDAPVRSGEVSGTPWHVDGSTFGNSVLQVIIKDAAGNEWVGATVPSSTFNASGVDFLITENGRIGTAYKLRAATWQCPVIADSDWFELSGVDYDEIESTLEVYEGTESIPNPLDDEDG